MGAELASPKPCSSTTPSLMISDLHNSGGGYSNGGYAGSSISVHNAHHRLGVPYGSSAVANRMAEERGRPAMDGDLLAAAPRDLGLKSLDSRLLHAHLPPGLQHQRGNRPDYRTEDLATSGHSAATRECHHLDNSARTSRNRPGRTGQGLPPNRSTGRDSYLANSAGSQPAHSQTERSFTSPRSSASSRDRFANPGSTPSSLRSPEPTRAAKSSSKLHLPHFSKAHMSSHSDSSQHGFSQRAPKQEHFSAPKFKAPKIKAPKASKSHGEEEATLPAAIQAQNPITDKARRAVRQGRRAALQRESATGMPQAPANRCRKSSQSRPFRASTSATSNHRFVVGDSDRNLERSKPCFDMIVQNSGKPISSLSGGISQLRRPGCEHCYIGAALYLDSDLVMNLVTDLLLNANVSLGRAPSSSNGLPLPSSSRSALFSCGDDISGNNLFDGDKNVPHCGLSRSECC